MGIMVDGLTIDNMVIGGPAHNSGQLDRGDLIAAVDFQPVSEETLQDLLVGQDVPSSSVTLTVIKAGSKTVTRDVVLTRMAVDAIADRCKMFELFAAMKVNPADTKCSMICVTLPTVILKDRLQMKVS